MSLIGFKSSNHPQQTARRGAADEVDDRGTDPEFIATLEDRLGKFTLDVAAAAHNAKAPRFYTREEDGLSQPWSRVDTHGEDWCVYHTNEIVWCNPPYSDIRPWVEKAWRERIGHLPGDRPDRVERDYLSDLIDRNLNHFPQFPGVTIAMLLPANRVEQGWWQDLVEPYRDRTWSPLRVEFLRGRMRFERPGWTPGPKGDRPPFGCALLIWGGGAA